GWPKVTSCSISRNPSSVLNSPDNGFLIAFALQCLHASKHAFVVSQQTKIGASEKSFRNVQGGRVKLYTISTVAAVATRNANHSVVFLNGACITYHMWIARFLFVRSSRF